MEQTSTKSIDVGGIFLMDLSVNESDASSQSDYQQSSDRLRTGNNRPNAGIASRPYCRELPARPATATANNNQATLSIAQDYYLKRANSNNIYRQPDYLCSSLDRLASVINCDELQQLQQQQENQLQEMATLSLANNSNIDDELTVTMVEPYQSPQPKQQSRYNILFCGETQPPPPRSSFSFSDESFAASSDASLSASFTGGSEEEEEDDACDRDSTTTREDSGVLDMKDLEGQLNSCNSFEDRNQSSSGKKYYSSDHYHSAENQISASINAARSPISSNKMKKNPQLPHRYGKPTDGSVTGCGYSGSDESKRGQQNHHHSHQYQNHQHVDGAKRRVSASLPIQVPARQMRKDLNKMKLNLLKEEQAIDQDLALGPGFEDAKPVAQEMILSKQKNQEIAIFEDDDAFLNQEYNANHHNHYPVDEHGHENLTAGDDPMKLFASIQALARSLHEDAEIFGSLPPKRTLESPIRSMALV